MSSFSEITASSADLIDHSGLSVGMVGEREWPLLMVPMNAEGLASPAALAPQVPEAVRRVCRRGLRRPDGCAGVRSRRPITGT